MDEDLLKAARHMYVAIVNYSGICFEPCEHDDCQHILASAAAWLEVDPLSSRLGRQDHPRFNDDVEPYIDDEFLEFIEDEPLAEEY